MDPPYHSLSHEGDCDGKWSWWTASTDTLTVPLTTVFAITCAVQPFRMTALLYGFPENGIINCD
jgi:hypothetical protein